MARTKPTARMSTGGRPPTRSVCYKFRSAVKAARTLLLVRNRGVGPLAKMPRDVVRIIAREIYDSRCCYETWQHAEALLALTEKKTELKRELAEVEKELREEKRNKRMAR